MELQDIATLSLRILAVFVASQAFVYFAELGSYLIFPVDPQSPATFTAVTIAALIAPCVVALIIWFAAPALAQIATARATSDPVVPSALSAQALMGAAFVVAGVVIFITALPSLVGYIITLSTSTANTILPNQVTRLITGILRCVLGLALVISPRVLTKLFLWLRYAGAGADNV